MHHYESECHAKRLSCYFQGQDHCKNWYNQNITVSDPFVTKLGLIVHHKPECFMEKLDCCVQDQGHSKISKCQGMFVQMISSETLNLLLPDLVWWCIIMGQIVFQKDLFAVFKVKVTATFQNSVNVCAYDICWIAESFTTKLGMVMCHYEQDCLSKRLVCCLQGQSYSHE